MNGGRPKILVTRPEPDTETTAARLSALGLEPVLAPLLVMQPLDPALPGPDQIAAIVFTSANAIRALQASGALARYSALPAFAVGGKTAAEAEAAGFAAVTAADGDLLSLAALLRTHSFAKPLFYPRAVHVSGDLTELLAPSGIEILQARVYAMAAAQGLSPDVERGLQSGDLAVGVFYSRRTAEVFCALAANRLDDGGRRQFAALCLSENVAAPLIAGGFGNIHLADYPSEEAMMTLALSFVRHQIR